MAADRRGAWYADPYGEADLRWWGGKRWTTQVKGSVVSEARAPQVAEPPAEQPKLAPKPRTIKRIGAPEPRELPTRTCAGCSRLTHTQGDFCPYCGRSFTPPPEPSFAARAGLMAIVVLGLVLLALAICIAIGLGQ